MGKNKLSLPGKQSRNCDMNSSASGADKGKEHMHITDPKKKKKSLSWKSVLNLCPWAKLHYLVPEVLLDQPGRSQATTEQSPLHKPKFCAVNSE